MERTPVCRDGSIEWECLNMSISLCPRRNPNSHAVLVVLAVAVSLALSGCQSRPKSQPNPLPPAPVQQVKVAVPVPCKIEQVAQKARPSTQARKGDDVFTLSKIALADRRVLMGENTELRAANNTPCPSR